MTDQVRRLKNARNRKFESISLQHGVCCEPAPLHRGARPATRSEVTGDRQAALGLGGSRVRVFCRIVLPIALPGILLAALFAFLASFDELLIALFLAGVRAQTLPVRIWNSLNLQVEPTIAAVSAFLISVTTLILAIEAVLRLRLGQRRGRA